MEFFDTVNARRSIRDFTDEKIPEDKLRKIVAAAYQAPANDHFRDWHYIVITDPETKRKVLNGVPKNLTVKDVDQMTFISDPMFHRYWPAGSRRCSDKADRTRS